jgi:hypothetical protein
MTTAPMITTSSSRFLLFKDCFYLLDKIASSFLKSSSIAFNLYAFDEVILTNGVDYILIILVDDASEYRMFSV